MKASLIASRYRVLGELGRGGMGVVYVVEHLRTGEKLALKVLQRGAAADPAALARFQREAQVAAKIRSDHVVRVTDADIAPELGGAPFLVMELLQGSDLEKLVGRLGPLGGNLLVGIFAQVAPALDRAHALGIVHRDLKPENLFLHEREEQPPMMKILDFGISKFLSGDAREDALHATATGAAIGTPYYMSPEQARGQIDMIGPATDMWAIGLIALRLLTRDSYWTAGSTGELMVQILETPMPSPTERWPHLGERFDAWFRRSCHRDPSQRWSSVLEQVTALAAALDVALPSGAGSLGRLSLAPIAPLLREMVSSRAEEIVSREGIQSGATVSVAWPAPSESSSKSQMAPTTSAIGILSRTPRLGTVDRSRWLVTAVIAMVGAFAFAFAYRALRRAPADIMGVQSKEVLSPVETAAPVIDAATTPAAAITPPVEEASPPLKVAPSFASTLRPAASSPARPTKLMPHAPRAPHPRNESSAADPLSPE